MALSSSDELLFGRSRSTESAETGAHRESRQDSPSLMMLVLIAVAGVLLYASFLLNPDHRGDPLAYWLVIVAETILILQALLALWTILSSSYDPRGFAFHNAREQLFDVPTVLGREQESTPRAWQLHLKDAPVTVDVFVTTYGESLETVRRTVTAALAMYGRHTTYVLDDGKSDEVRALAEELGAVYVRRVGNAGAKAGNVNHALSITDGDFFVVLDADFAAEPQFLLETVPFFADTEVAFVQTPQHYGNLHSLLSRGAGYMQSVFYRLIQPGKNRFNAAFCVGTNVIFRRTAIEDIGGIYEQSKSEDIWTSILLHERGWKSVYIPTVLATGDTPETIEAYSKQQLRWATGGFEILLRHNPLSRRRNLTVDQRLQYFGTSIFYLNGIVPMLLLLVPPLQVYFDLTPVSLEVSWFTWLLYYAGFYFMQIVVAFYTIGSFRWETLMLATASFPIYVRALLNALFHREQAWSVTGRTGTAASPFNFIGVQVMVFVFLLATTVVGTWKALGTDNLSLALIWNTLNTVVLGAFVVTAHREARRLRRDARTAPRAASTPDNTTEGPTQRGPVQHRPRHAVSARADDTRNEKEAA